MLNTQQCKVCIEGKMEQSRERSIAPLHLGVVAIEMGAFESLSTKVTNFALLNLQEREIRGDVIETSKIINPISNYEELFCMLHQTRNLQPNNFQKLSLLTKWIFVLM